MGGGYSGSSGESSSVRHGLFENTVNQVEIVLGDGSIVRASHSENSDLYYGAGGCFGTLGVVTKLEVQLMKAEPFVELEYLPVQNSADAVRVIESCTADSSIHYLDGIMFSSSSGVIIAGRMVDTDVSKSSMRCQRYLRPWDAWFFIRAEEILRHMIDGKYRELVPLKDYLFRYDRGAFWAGQYCFDYFLTPFNRFTRWALDDLLHTKVMYEALHKSGLANEYIIQDIGFPYDQVPQFTEYLDKSFKHYPLWLCPLRMMDHISLSPRLPPYKTGQKDLRILNVGVWGPAPKDYARFVEMNREIEKKTMELGGLKTLYAHAYYTEDEFWQIYDRKWYDGLRAKYNAHLIPSVFEKVTVNDFKDEGSIRRPIRDYIAATWPVRGLYGAFHVLLNRKELGLPLSPIHIFLFPPFFLALIAWTVLWNILASILSPLTALSRTTQKSKRH